MECVALVVGVGDYDSARVPNLPVTALDAQALSATLRDPRTCGYLPEQVDTLLGAQATLAHLRDALRALRSRATRDATCIVYFSGHGGRLETPDGWHAYLCPRDTDPRALDTTALPAEEFTAALAAIPAGRLVVILDACFASATADLKAIDDEQWKGGWAERQYEELARGSGRVVIASSKAGQPSYARQQDGLSLFTKYLLEALRGEAAVRGDGLVHVLDVFHYVSDAVRRAEPRQEPILKAQNLDANFAIALAPAYVSVAMRDHQPIEAVRQEIVRDPVAGAAALSAFLASQPDAAALRAGVDLRQSELERLRHAIAQSSSEADLAARNAIVFFLLRACSDLATGIITPVPALVPAAAPPRAEAPAATFTMTVNGPDSVNTIVHGDATFNFDRRHGWTDDDTSRGTR